MWLYWFGAVFNRFSPERKHAAALAGPGGTSGCRQPFFLFRAPVRRGGGDYLAFGSLV